MGKKKRVLANMDYKGTHDNHFISISELFFYSKLVFGIEIHLVKLFHFSISRIDFYFRNKFGT